MVQPAIATIVAAICAAAGAFLGTVATVLNSNRIARKEHCLEERDAVGKYRDALLHACEDLQSHLMYLCEGRVPPQDNNLKLSAQTVIESYGYLYIIYLIGRLFCWMFITINNIQSTRYKPTAVDIKITNILYRIGRLLENPASMDGDMTFPFQIYRGIQASIGEKMLVSHVGSDSEQSPRCIGYAKFLEQWVTPKKNGEQDPDWQFTTWFNQVVEGLEQRRGSDANQRSRIVSFQHHLVDLAQALDPRQERTYRRERVRFKETNDGQRSRCGCTTCSLLIPVGPAPGGAAVNTVHHGRLGIFRACILLIH